MKLQYTPAGHRLLVKVKAAEEVTKGGIVLPADVRERETVAAEIGELVAIGANAWLAYDNGDPWGKVGDTIAFIRHAGNLTEIDGVDHRIINDVDMLAVVKEIEEEGTNVATNGSK